MRPQNTHTHRTRHSSHSASCFSVACGGLVILSRRLASRCLDSSLSTLGFTLFFFPGGRPGRFKPKTHTVCQSKSRFDRQLEWDLRCFGFLEPFAPIRVSLTWGKNRLIFSVKFKHFVAILIAFSGIIPGHVITQTFPSGSFWVNLLEFDLFRSHQGFPGVHFEISSLKSIRNHGGLLGLRELGRAVGW